MPADSDKDYTGDDERSKKAKMMDAMYGDRKKRILNLHILAQEMH